MTGIYINVSKEAEYRFVGGKIHKKDKAHKINTKEVPPIKSVFRQKLTFLFINSLLTSPIVHAQQTNLSYNPPPPPFSLL